jgi:hypothetical protein
MLPEIVTVDQPIQIAAGQRTADHQLKYLTAHYSAVGQLTKTNGIQAPSWKDGFVHDMILP